MLILFCIQFGEHLTIHVVHFVNSINILIFLLKCVLFHVVSDFLHDSSVIPDKKKFSGGASRGDPVSHGPRETADRERLCDSTVSHECGGSNKDGQIKRGPTHDQVTAAAERKGR